MRLISKIDETRLCGILNEFAFDFDLSLMQNIGLKMYQPWYNIKPIFRISKYYDEFRRSIDSVDKFLRMVRHT